MKASNNDGVWNEQGASIGIVITPPYWATWWFRALVTLSVVAIVVMLIRRAQARQQYLQAMNQQLGLAAEHDRESQQYLERNVLDILGAMQQFSAGDYSVALDVASDDAIGKLRLGFNSVVADRKRAEEELRQSQKMEAVGRLAGGGGHDFNNLLTVIKGNAELALADLEGNELVKDELEEIERAAERASSLTRQLLAFSRKQILKPQTLSLNDMVVEIARMLRRTVGEDIELRIVLDPSLGSVKADPGQLEQVLLNLVVNARDAMPRGGQLIVETKNVDAEAVRGFAEAEQVPYVAIVVTDTGTGMPPAVRDRVFEPFFTTKEQGKGTGLGLSTVYGSVKQSGGFVMVESGAGGRAANHGRDGGLPSRFGDGAAGGGRGRGAATRLARADAFGLSGARRGERRAGDGDRGALRGTHRSAVDRRRDAGDERTRACPAADAAACRDAAPLRVGLHGGRHRAARRVESRDGVPGETVHASRSSAEGAPGARCPAARAFDAARELSEGR